MIDKCNFTFLDRLKFSILDLFYTKNIIITKMNNLTEHFTLEELTYSYNIDNRPK